jgi:hypothetical protein
MNTQTEIERLRKANPFPATRIENEVLFGEIIATLGDPRLTRGVRAPRRRSSRQLLSKRAILVAAAALLIGAGSSTAIVGWSVFAPTEGQLEAERGGTLSPGSFRTLRSLKAPAGVTWTVVTYKTTKYECFDVYGGITGSAEPAGAVGGCGPPPFSDEQVIAGGIGGTLRVGTEMFALTGGRVAPNVATVRATFTGGSTAVDHPIGGIWLFVGSPDRSPTLVEALDEQGELLARLPLEPTER